MSTPAAARLRRAAAAPGRNCASGAASAWLGASGLSVLPARRRRARPARTTVAPASRGGDRGRQPGRAGADHQHVAADAPPHRRRSARAPAAPSSVGDGAADPHAVGDLGQAGALADPAVDRHHAVEAGAHAAMQAPRRARRRCGDRSRCRRRRARRRPSRRPAPGSAGRRRRMVTRSVRGRMVMLVRRIGLPNSPKWVAVGGKTGTAARVWRRGPTGVFSPWPNSIWWCAAGPWSPPPTRCAAISASRTGVITALARQARRRGEPGCRRPAGAAGRRRHAIATSNSCSPTAPPTRRVLRPPAAACFAGGTTSVITFAAQFKGHGLRDTAGRIPAPGAALDGRLQLSPDHHRPDRRRRARRDPGDRRLRASAA